ncbi:MAG: TonB-dependent receptor [Flavobacteriales bacterium]|nr:TonB-dependent receptor [Flavobacteriales bacterium]
MIRNFLLVLGMLAGSFALAQTGTITGVVLAMENGMPQPQPFASVAIKGTTRAASTDLDGRFSLSAAPGTYTLVASQMGQASLEREVVLGQASTAQVELIFGEGGVQMGTVEVVRERRVDTEAAVLMAVRNSGQVANGVGREQIAKGQDRHAADVVKRIPGITITDGRFVLVRGLSDRYSSVLLNGVAAPSLEPDKRAFSFDLLPSGALDRLLIQKSGAPGLPGDFAGGVIELTTMGVPRENELKVSYGLGIRAGTTFQDLRQDQRSSTDFLGFDDGSRTLPSAFPAHLNAVAHPDQLATLGRALPNTWGSTVQQAAPDQRFGLLIARRLGMPDARNKYGTVTALNLSNTNAAWTARQYNYNAYDAAAQQSDTIYTYTDRENVRTARTSVMHNWSALLGTGTKLEFRNLFIQTGENRTTERTGNNLEEGFEVRNFAHHYTQRTVYSGQLHGSHDLGHGGSHMDWTVGHGRAWSQEPDLRRIRTVRDIGSSDAPFQVVIAPTASTLDAGRFFSNLDEQTWTGRLDLGRKLGDEEARITAQIDAGLFAERKDRSFSARWMSFRKANSGQFNQALASLPPEQVFADANINGSTGFKLEEGTNPSDSYTAANTLLAGHLGTAVRWAKRLRVSGGVRLEHNRQELEGATYGGIPVRVDNPVPSVLPSVNAALDITEKSLVRVAWSNTVNRPEFRELAPFSFYDFSTNNVLYGNPGLTTATISNVEARWEMYPGLGEVISAGVFSKSFTDPIELFFVPGAGSGGTRNFTFRNAESARSIGAEVEVRRSLNGAFTRGIPGRTGVLFNATLVHSTVTLGPEAVGQANERPMMGQSPYVVNAGLFVADSASRLQCNVVYNIHGKRLHAVGSAGTPDIYEMPAGQLDITVGKQLGERFNLKLGASNVLNARTLLMQDGNGDGRLTTGDEEVTRFRQGACFSGELSYSF